MKNILILLLLFSINVFSQLSSDYKPDIQSDISKYAGYYELEPNYQITNVLILDFFENKSSGAYYLFSESPEGKTKVTYLKDISFEGNEFKSEKMKGRFVTANFEYNSGDNEIVKKRVKGLLLDNMFYIRKEINIAASSRLIEKDKPAVYYSPYNSFANYADCAWVEGAKGDGVGEWIKYEFDEPKTINIIMLFNGYGKSESIFKNNARIKKLKLTFSNGNNQIVELKDIFEMQEIIINKEISTTSVKFEIIDVYKGSKFRDACISSVSFEFK